MIFLISIILITFFHEFSHLIAAKIFQCDVKVFSIGFGKKIWSKKIGKTEYKICPLLLGGYCKLESELEDTKNIYSFSNLSYTKKIIISLAGITINIVMGLITLYLGNHYYSYNLLYFGFMSLTLGLFNLIPFIPCLDGGYVFFIPILYNIYGQEVGLQIFKKWVEKSYSIIMIINILFLPYLLWLLITGKI